MLSSASRPTLSIQAGSTWTWHVAHAHWPPQSPSMPGSSLNSAASRGETLADFDGEPVAIVSDKSDLDHSTFLIFESKVYAPGRPPRRNGQFRQSSARWNARTCPLLKGLSDPPAGAVYRGRIYLLEFKYLILQRSRPDDTSKLPSEAPSRSTPC